MATRSGCDVWRKTHRVLDALETLGIETPNTSGLPIIEIPLADHETIDEVGRYLFDHGIYATMAAFPLVPKREVGFRIQITAANGDDEIEELISVLTSLKERFQLHQVDRQHALAAPVPAIPLQCSVSEVSDRTSGGGPGRPIRPRSCADMPGSSTRSSPPR